MTLPLAAELLRRRAVRPKPYLEGLFPQQTAFVTDKAKKKTALCSRRAGKTEAVAAWFLEGGEDCPGGLSVYIARSRNNARLILWNTLQRIDQRHNLGLAFKEVDGQLMVELPNRHRIWLAGCKDSVEIDKFRGVGGVTRAGLRRAAVDEAQSFPPWLKELVDDVLEPALLDQDGELALVGTPGPIPTGPFYEWTTGDGGVQWSTHHWSVLDNPFIPHAGTWLATKRETNHWGEDHPTYVREWLGRWVKDTDALVYPYDSAINVIDKHAPEWQWFEAAHESDRVYILGVDLGTSKEEPTTAFTLVGFVRRSANVFVLKSWKRADMSPTGVAAEVLRVKGVYRLTKTVIDEGGLGGGYTKELNDRFGLGVEPAKKSQKRAFIDFVSGDLKSGVIKVDPWEARELVDEWQVLPWNEDRDAPDDRFPDHGSDSALYALREARTYYKPTEEGPAAGTPEAVQAEMDKYKRGLEQQIITKQKRRQREEMRRLLRAGRR